MTTLPEKIKLNDDERSRIRWASTKKGFVVRTEFEKHWTRRGNRDIRPMRSRAYTTEAEARRNAGDVRNRPLFVSGTRHPAIVAEVQILQVDALGNVVDLIEVL
jgi:hypothetical protein